jgi:hypothetical protein
MVMNRPLSSGLGLVSVFSRMLLRDAGAGPPAPRDLPSAPRGTVTVRFLERPAREARRQAVGARRSDGPARPAPRPEGSQEPRPKAPEPVAHGAAGGAAPPWAKGRVLRAWVLSRTDTSDLARGPSAATSQPCRRVHSLSASACKLAANRTCQRRIRSRARSSAASLSGSAMARMRSARRFCHRGAGLIQ